MNAKMMAWSTNPWWSWQLWTLNRDILHHTGGWGLRTGHVRACAMRRPLVVTLWLVYGMQPIYNNKSLLISNKRQMIPFTTAKPVRFKLKLVYNSRFCVRHLGVYKELTWQESPAGSCLGPAASRSAIGVPSTLSAVASRTTWLVPCPLFKTRLLYDALIPMSVPKRIK